MSYAGTAKQKRNCWLRGNGSGTMRGELKRGISMNKKTLNRKVRRDSKLDAQHCNYKKICKTIHMVRFT